jgi:hypothetical protein
MPTSKIAEEVQEVIKSKAASVYFPPEVEDAIRLADLFDSVKPEVYVVPLDAMAGFVNPDSRTIQQIATPKIDVKFDSH